MYNILVTGANGQLGSELRFLASAYSSHNFIFTDRETLDITNQKAVENFIEGYKITAIINCAAYTAVDRAESEISIASEINHLAIENFANLAQAYGIKLIHISTDYVFDGNNYKPYTVTDIPNPQSVYGKTKLAGERAMQKINPANSFIIRTSWVYSSFGNNFVKTMLQLGENKEVLNVICDQVGTPTYARDLGTFILDNLLEFQCENVMVYHYTNEGVCSWYDFAREVMKLGKKKCKIDPILSSDYPTSAQRPFYSLLDKSMVKQHFNVRIAHWKEGLEQCIVLINRKSKN